MLKADTVCKYLENLKKRQPFQAFQILLDSGLAVYVMEAGMLEIFGLDDLCEVRWNNEVYVILLASVSAIHVYAPTTSTNVSPG